jgi:hypothetical protein
MSAPDCSGGCERRVPVIRMDICIPITNPGQLQYMYVTNLGNPFADITDLAEWAARLSNTSADVDAIRKFHIIGSKPAAESNEKIISLNRTQYGVKRHTYNIRIDETNDENYEAMREFECGGEYLVWPQTSGGLIYGSPEDINNGIRASIKLDDVIPESIQDNIEFQGTIKFSHKLHPSRGVSPIA